MLTTEGSAQLVDALRRLGYVDLARQRLPDHQGQDPQQITAQTSDPQRPEWGPLGRVNMKAER